MNCSLLDDEEYVDSVTELIPMWITEGRQELSDDRCVWDWIKYNIRAHTIRHSKRKTKQRNETETKLQNQLNVAKKAVETNPSDDNATLLDAAQKQLQSFYEEKTKGIIVCARVRWHEQGEKSTNHIKKHIRTLHISGVTKTDPSCILKEIDQIYCDLYKTNNNLTDIEFKIDSFLNDLNIPSLSEEQKNSCEGKISSEECFRILTRYFSRQQNSGEWWNSNRILQKILAFNQRLLY